MRIMRKIFSKNYFALIAEEVKILSTSESLPIKFKIKKNTYRLIGKLIYML